MTVDDAYRILKLTPIDEFLYQGEKKGSTTVMLVVAAILVRKDTKVVVVLRNQRHAVLCKGIILDYIERLNAPGEIVRKLQQQGTTGIRFTSGGTLLLTTNRNFLKLPQATGRCVLRDQEWERIVTNRIKDPLDRVQYLVEVEKDGETTYEGRDPAWDFLFEMTPEGARRLVEDDLMLQQVQEAPEAIEALIGIWGR